MASHYYPNSTTATITTTSGYVFTSVDVNDAEAVGLKRVSVSPYYGINYKTSGLDGIFVVPFSGWYMISGQLCFESNTAGNRWVLNHYNNRGSWLYYESVTLCQEPVSYTAPFIRPFHLIKLYTAGESFSISISEYHGVDVLNFGNNYNTSFLKVLMIA